jgi:hypothetical protein
MNNKLVTGLVVGIALLMLIRFPEDSITLIENVFSLLGDIWDAVRNLIREFI